MDRRDLQATREAVARRQAARRARPARAGLSLVEVLIALSITAMLLTAVAGAYSASAKAIEINDQFFRASQSARVSVNRIAADLRKCDSGALTGTSELTILFPDGQTRVYKHDATAKTLTLTRGVAPDVETFTVASNVESASFYTDGASVGVNIVVSVGTNKIVLNGSATPRRRMTYN